MDCTNIFGLSVIYINGVIYRKIGDRMNYIWIVSNLQHNLSWDGWSDEPYLDCQKSTGIIYRGMVDWTNRIWHWMDNFDIFFGLKLAYLIFSAAEQVSIDIQAKDITVQEAV